MSSTRAIVVGERGVAEIQETLVPALAHDWILIQVNSIALNPTDWKHVDYGWADTGARLGCDYAGVVEDIGSKVTKFKKGSRVAGMVHGGDKTHHENGAFASYITAKPNLQLEIPETITDEEAATLGVAVTTVGQALYKSLGLPLPNTPVQKPFPILIHAASTSTGMMGVQFAKASGLMVIATTSPHNFDTVRLLGADVVLDYASPTCGSDIRKLTDNKLVYAWDCIGKGAELCATALSDTEACYYASVDVLDEELVKKTNANVRELCTTIAYDAFGEEYIWNDTIVPPKADELAFASMFWELAADLLRAGTIRPLRAVINKTGSGLEGALKGMDELRAGNVSGAKLVYTI